MFSILNAGPFDGWAKISILSDCNLGFSIFLAVVQSLTYLTACALGIFNIIKASRVSDFNVTHNDNSYMGRVHSIMIQCQVIRMSQTTQENTGNSIEIMTTKSDDLH